MVNPYQSPEVESERIAASEKKSGFLPRSLVVIIGLLIPGLPTAVIRRDGVGLTQFLALLAAVPAAFGFFGPFWGEVLFAGTPIKEWGLYPFIATCVCVPLASVIMGLRDLSRSTRPNPKARSDASADRSQAAFESV